MRFSDESLGLCKVGAQDLKGLSVGWVDWLCLTQLRVGSLAQRSATAERVVGGVA